MKSCPCGSNKPYEQCCGPYLRGSDAAPTAEALMRSRYTAYSEKNAAYLLTSWHPSTRPEPDELGLNDTVSWSGLEIIMTKAGGKDDETGVVEFIAHYFNAKRLGSIHERSRFGRHEGRWVYVDGEVQVQRPEHPGKIGRNDPCYCGSGKKYKKCCLRQEK